MTPPSNPGSRRLYGIAVDERIGGSPRFFIDTADPGRPMQVPDVVRKSVVFLAYNAKNGSVKLAGTGFFVSVPIPELADAVAMYLVTARHCIEQAKRASIDNTVLLRINLSQGGTSLIETDADAWLFLDDERIDLAALPIAGSLLDDSVVDFRHGPVEMFVTPQLIQQRGIGIGDEVFTIGLFTQHVGQGANIPILRAGN